jgi:hypothetical protein
MLDGSFAGGTASRRPAVDRGLRLRAKKIRRGEQKSTIKISPSTHFFSLQLKPPQQFRRSKSNNTVPICLYFTSQKIIYRETVKMAKEKVSLSHRPLGGEASKGEVS